MVAPELHIRPSRQLAAFLMLLHAGALIMVLFVHLGWIVNLVVGVGIVISFITLFHHHAALRSGQSITKVTMNARGQWKLESRNGGKYTCTLKGNSIVNEQILILNFKPVGPRKKKTPANFSVLICPDAVSKKAYRQTKAWVILKKK